MNYVTILTLVILILVYSILSFIQLSKIKRKIVNIINGKVEDKQLSKVLDKARILNKNKFVVYMCLSHGLIFSIVTMLVVILIHVLFTNDEFDFIKYLVVFLFIIVTFTLNLLIKANLIWRISRQE